MMDAPSGDGEIGFSVGAYSAMHAPNVAIMWLVMGSGTEEGERMKRWRRGVDYSSTHSFSGGRGRSAPLGTVLYP